VDRDEFTDTSSSTQNAGLYRGCVYQVDTSVPLKLIEQWLTINAATQLEFFVYSNPTMTGTFTKIFSTTVASGTGTGWQSSGPIDVPLNAGTFYLVGCGAMGQATFFDDGGTAGLPAAVSFGSVVARGGGNSYPPPATSVVNGVGANISAQAVETGEPVMVSLLSPGSGSVPVSGSVVVNLQADGGGAAPGTYLAQLDIDSNDPGTATLSVPIEINVSDATATPGLTAALPTALALHPTVPNPTRSSSTIRYDVPRSGPVRLSVYDVSGRLVRTLRDGPEEPGFRTVTWDGRDAGGRRVSSGVYFYTLRTDEKVLQRKLVMLR
jgi:hypothetical protein